jgi:hypothetical protein
MGQQNEKFAHANLTRSVQYFCDAKIYRAAKRLAPTANFLRCNPVDAAMHNRMREQDSRLESIIESNKRIVDEACGYARPADTLSKCIH